MAIEVRELEVDPAGVTPIVQPVPAEAPKPEVTLSAAVTIEQEALKGALDKLAKFVDGRSSLPILSYVLLEATSGTLVLSATDLEVALRLTIPTTGSGAFRVAAPCKWLHEVVAGAVKAEKLAAKGKKPAKGEAAAKPTLSLAVEVTRTPNPKPLGPALITHKLLVTKASGHLRINAMDAEEYPHLPYTSLAEGEALFTIESNRFKREIERIGRYAAKDEARPIFTGILFEVKKGAGRHGSGRMVAADSYRLAWSDIPLRNLGKEAQFLAPSGGLETLRRVLPDAVEVHLALSPTGGQLLIGWEGALFLSRTIDGKYPDYRRIGPNPAKTAHSLQIEPDALTAGLEAFSKAIFEDSNNILTLALEVQRQVLRLSAKGEEAEQDEDVAVKAATRQGSTEKLVLLNYVYLKEAVLGFAGPLVLRTWAPGKPVHLRAADTQADSHQVILMPMHTIR